MPPAGAVRVALVTAVLALGVPKSGAASEFPANVRPLFDAGYSLPVRYGQLKTGYGFGFGLEVEHTPRVTMLFRFEYEIVERELKVPGSPYYQPYVAHEESSSSTWLVGVRGYLARPGLRPYGELGFGIRLEGNRSDYVNALDAVSHGELDQEGPVGAGRLGFSTARPGGAGLFAESGYEFVIQNPGDFAIVPLRVGIVFP